MHCELSNGLKYSIIKTNTKTISISLVLRAGTMHEEKNGAAHFLEHMLLKHQPVKEITEELDFLGVDYNAITGRDLVVYKVLTLEEHMESSLRFFKALLTGFYAASKDIEIEKRIIENEIRRYASKTPNIQFSDILDKGYTGPFARPMLGTFDSVNSITEKDLIDFYESLYQPSNTVLCLCGDMEEDRTKEKIENLFYDIPSKGILDFNKVYLSEQKSKYIYEQKDAEQSNICMAYKSPGIQDPYYAVNIILRTILFDGTDSILYKRLREEKGYIYILNGYLDSYKGNNLSHLLIYTSTNAKNTQVVIDVISETLESLSLSGISSYEMSKAVNKIKMETYKNNDLHYKYSTLIASNIINGMDEQSSVLPHLDAISNESMKKLLNRYYNSTDRILYIS